MMLRLAHRFLVVLIVFAIIGGPPVHLAQPAQYAVPVAMADMPCEAMIPMADSAQGTPMPPCKGLTPDCIKQMGCVADVAVPTRLAGTDVVLAYISVAYWSAPLPMAGLVRQPEPIPPRTT